MKSGGGGGGEESRPPDWPFFPLPGTQETIFYLRVAWFSCDWCAHYFMLETCRASQAESETEYSNRFNFCMHSKMKSHVNDYLKTADVCSMYFLVMF